MSDLETLKAELIALEKQVGAKSDQLNEALGARFVEAARALSARYPRRKVSVYSENGTTAIEIQATPPSTTMFDGWGVWIDWRGGFDSAGPEKLVEQLNTAIADWQGLVKGCEIDHMPMIMVEETLHFRGGELIADSDATNEAEAPDMALA